MRRTMRNSGILVLFLFLFNVASAQEKETFILVSTNSGDMKIKLYNDTPRHRDYVISLIQSRYYDGSLFSRVIPEFMIQGGASDSKNAATGAKVGYGSSTMLLAPEIRNNHYPKKGAVAMPRQPDNINPKKQSDASQFFIVQGRVFTPLDLRAMELKKNKKARDKALATFYTPYETVFDSLKTANPVEYNKQVRSLNARIDSLIRTTPDHLLFDPEEKESYTTSGGAPHLRNEYTIFGEVTEGLDVIDKIANLKRDKNDRPEKDVIMKVSIIN